MTSLAPKGRVEIRVSRYPTGGERHACARLLTPELQLLIERQNIDCSDINSMKWPLFGLSRHATCKLLMLQRDLMDLLLQDPQDWNNDSYAPNSIYTYDGFRIWFIVGSEVECERNAFNRMHIAEIQPLIISQFGKENFGEALYIVTFKCDRWAARSNRKRNDDFYVTEQFYSRSWDPSKFVRMGGVSLSAADIAEKFIDGLPSSSYNWWRFTRIGGATGTDIYDASMASSPKWLDPEGVRGIDTAQHKPINVILDEIAARTGVAFMYKPIGSPSIPGSYQISPIDIAQGNQRMVSFLNDYEGDIQVGSILDVKDGPPSNNFDGIAKIARIPNVIAQPMRPKKAVVGVRRDIPADGAPPDVFGQCIRTSGPFVEGQFQNEFLADPFSRDIFKTSINVPAENDVPYLGEAGAVHISADDWAKSVRPNLVTNIDNDEDGRWTHLYRQNYTGVDDLQGQDRIAVDVAQRWAEKYSAGVCDIWFRSWIMPTVEQCWPGGSWIEFRLQTDGEGFPFPTTRIHGSFDDPLLGPVADDRQHEIEGSGMVQTWRGEDGRLRVHVGMPFGIPCLIKIVSNQPYEEIGGIVRDNVWKYTAKIVHKRRGDQLGFVNTDFAAGLGSWESTEFGTDPEIIAYNLCEANNSASFAGPGYKLPLVQDGFRVLPIGEDRDGVLHEVVVQAMLYMTDQYDAVDDAEEGRICAFFCLHNAIDGECDTSAFVEPTYDGGTFDGGA